MPDALRPSILFVCDAGPAVGGGHVMRSLTLAQALHARGFAPVFAATPEVAGVLDRFAGPWAGRIAAASDQLDRLRASDLGAAAVVFDHYGLGAAQHRAIAAGAPVLVIDDLADRPLGGDLVLDPSPGRTRGDYTEKAAGADLLLGPDYALVRPVFAALRIEALARRAKPAEGLLRVLVSLGLTDVGAITERVVTAILPFLEDVQLTVVLGSGATSRPVIELLTRKHAGIGLEIDTRDMAPLTAKADLVIGAGGSSTWERCVLGAPTLHVVLADNQAEAALRLEALGAVVRLDARSDQFEADVALGFRRAVRDAALRGRLSEISAGLCDGRGAERVADALTARLESGARSIH